MRERKRMRTIEERTSFVAPGNGMLGLVAGKQLVEVTLIGTVL
jgi:hypothetical protein